MATEPNEEVESQGQPAPTDTATDVPVIDENAAAEETPPGEGQDASADVEPAPEPQKWDKARQEIDQEKANLRKQKEEIDREKAEIAAAKEALKTQAPASADDSLTDDLLTQAEQINAEAEELAELDPSTAAKKTAQANKLLLQHARQQTAVATESKREAQQWAKYAADNPELDVQKVKAARDEAYQEAAKAGYEGKYLNTRMQELLAAKIDSCKKANKPSTPAPNTVRKPAPTTRTASGSSPAGTSVIPAATGERKTASTYKDAAKNIGSAFL